jgi:hypothetical protein
LIAPSVPQSVTTAADAPVAAVNIPRPNITTVNNNRCNATLKDGLQNLPTAGQWLHSAAPATLRGLRLDIMTFTTYATVASHTLAIDGYPNSGWRSVGRDTPGARLIEFTFSIQDDGNGNYLLVYSSLDGVFAADTWHETLDEAVAMAEAELGVERGEWTATSSKDSKRGGT